MKFYSKSTGCIYIKGLHAAMPDDAVEISESRYQQVIANPAPGKIRSHDAHGLPILIDPPVYVPTTDDHRAVVAARRWQAEVAGINVSGMHIDTDDRSKTLITGSAIKAMRDPEYTLNWKTPDGFIQIPATQVLAMADAVSDHVQACFDREAELLGALADGTFTAEMLEEGWPNESVPEPFAG